MIAIVRMVPVDLPSECVRFLIDPGTATAMEIAELYDAISRLYEAMGGSGLRFEVEL